MWPAQGHEGRGWPFWRSNKRLVCADVVVHFWLKPPRGSSSYSLLLYNQSDQGNTYDRVSTVFLMLEEVERTGATKKLRRPDTGFG